MFPSATFGCGLKVLSGGATPTEHEELSDTVTPCPGVRMSEVTLKQKSSGHVCGLFSNTATGSDSSLSRQCFYFHQMKCQRGSSPLSSVENKSLVLFFFEKEELPSAQRKLRQTVRSDTIIAKRVCTFPKC